MMHFSLQGYQLVSEPVYGLDKRSLHLLKFKTQRNEKFMSLVSLTGVYQLDERIVIVHMYGREPSVNLRQLTIIMSDLPVAFIWPLNLRPNRCIANTISRLFPRGTLNYHIFTIGSLSNYDS